MLKIFLEKDYKESNLDLKILLNLFSILINEFLTFKYWDFNISIKILEEIKNFNLQLYYLHYLLKILNYVTVQKK